MARRALRSAMARIERPGDALMIAETMGRMAAISGDEADIRLLGDILLARAGHERDRGNEESAAYYEADAWKQFRALADRNDPDALATLAILPEPRFDVGNYDGIDGRLSAAANGDMAALAALYDHAAKLLAVGGISLADALATREILARLAVASGDTAHFWRFVETMLDRDDFERKAGNRAGAESARSEALVALGALADGGDAEAPEWIERLASAPADVAVSQAIIERPTIMRFINAQGEC
jgi:hypothetical protein